LLTSGHGHLKGALPRREGRVPNGDILENLDDGSPTDLGALAEPIRIEDGWFTPPDRPGHGIMFDRAVLPPTRSNPDEPSG
jgi:hypothetical protein